MPEFKPFGATNQPDTCLWCGEPLYHRNIVEWETYETPLPAPIKSTIAGEPDHTHNTRSRLKTVGHEEKGGYDNDGLFCTLRCGFQFGQRMAQNGRRLFPSK